MVDITRAEAQLLREICADPSKLEAAMPTLPPLEVPYGAIVIAARTPDELLPLVTQTVSRRYSDLPPEHISRDLNYLIKKGLGNAYKWGNRKDPAKLLIVMAVMTDMGVLIKITDQGSGFDVGRVAAQVNRKTRYFVHGGSGWAHFQSAASVVSYADGGRTLLIRFLRDAGQAAPHSRRAPEFVKAASNRIDLTRLGPGIHVKIKGTLEAGSRFSAAKIKIKPPEDLAVVEAELQSVNENGRWIQLLGWSLALPDSVEITSAALGPLDRSVLHAGQIVELRGSYSREEGFVPVGLKVRNEPILGFVELQGTIERIDETDGTITVLGIAVGVGAATELIQ